MPDPSSLNIPFENYENMIGKKTKIPTNVKDFINQFLAKENPKKVKKGNPEKRLAIVGSSEAVPSETEKGDPSKATKGETLFAADLKAALSNMPLENDAHKEAFKQMLTFYLLEQVFLPFSSPKKVCTASWWWVQNLSLCEKVNWPKQIETWLHEGLSNLKRSLEDSPNSQHEFKGCTPVFEVCLKCLG